MPLVDLWPSAHIPSLIATFVRWYYIQPILSAASWAECAREAARLVRFKGGRPAATTGWWKGSSGSWYYCGQALRRATKHLGVSDGGQWY